MNDAMSIGGEYDLKARIYPTLLAASPISITGVVFGITSARWWETVASLAVASGFWFLAAQVGRSPGKRLEPGLWKSWGGAPTTIALRYRDAKNPVRVRGRHERVTAVTGLVLPPAEEETADPAAADATYEAVVAELIEKTRGDALLFKENVNYGFRRNMLGLRPWAIGVCGLAAGATAFVTVTGQPSSIDVEDGLGITLIALDGFSAGAWWKLVTPEWVKQTAFAYSDRLFEAAGSLSR